MNLKPTISINAAVLAMLLASGCEPADRDVPLVLRCQSENGPGFLNLEPIPAIYTLAEGENISPPLKWNDGPAATAQWAIVFEDRDAASDRQRVRWLIYHLPAYLRELPAGVPPDIADLGREYFQARQGRNAQGTTEVGYRGPDPAPGSGVHRYRFTLYALDAVLDIPPGATRAELERKIQGHVLARTVLEGKYGEPAPVSESSAPETGASQPPAADPPVKSGLEPTGSPRGPGPPEPAEF